MSVPVEEVAPDPGTPNPPLPLAYTVYNASGTLTASYSSQAAAQAHCASWASGLYWRGP